MIAAILFDIDGVLVDSKAANLELYKRLMVAAGYREPSAEEVLSRFHLPLKRTIAELGNIQDESEVLRIMALVSSPDMRVPHLYEFPDGLKPTLERLHGEYRLGVVTSRIKFGVEEVLETAGVRELFEVEVAFEDYTNPKPHPEPLLVALGKLGVGPDKAIYIGDSRSDIDAAMAAGMRSIHLSADPHESATAVVAEFRHIADAIEGMRV